MRAEPFDRAVGVRIGVELVELRMSAPQVIGSTVRLLADRLPALLVAPGRYPCDALPRVDPSGDLSGFPPDRDLDGALPGRDPVSGGDGGPGVAEAGAEVLRRLHAVLEQVVNGFVAAQRDAAVRAGEDLNRAEKMHWRETQRDLQQRLRHALLHQHRSGLPNRAHLRQHLAEAIRGAGRIGLCLLSIDRFADLGDALGPDVAEDLLDAVATRLEPVARQGGYFLAHLGEEFALVISGTSGADDVLKAADQARRALDSAPAPALDGYPLRLTATTGVVENATAGTRPDTWLRDAHLALGWARADGRDCAVHEPARAAADLHRHRLAAALPAGLERGEIVAWYQPLCRLGTASDAMPRPSEIVGVEALARWRRPAPSTSPAVSGALPAGARSLPAAAGSSLAGASSSPAGASSSPAGAGSSPVLAGSSPAMTGSFPAVAGSFPVVGRGSTIIGPDQFITVAERTGLIVPLGRTILEQACRQGVTWREQGHDLLISVNLSPLQLLDPNLPADLAAILRDSGLAADRLQLEITESAALGEGRDILRRLTGLGTRIAIDDFGTGYSSLALLPHLPVTDVKLAGEFVTSAAASTGAVLRHIIGLCHDLDIRVTAEALETQADVDRLRELGCDLGQGYHFARPMPADELFPHGQ